MNCQQVLCGCYLTCNVILTEGNSPFPVIVRSQFFGFQDIFGVSSTDSKSSVHKRWPYRRIIHNKHMVLGCQIFKEWEEGLCIRRESEKESSFDTLPSLKPVSNTVPPRQCYFVFIECFLFCGNECPETSTSELRSQGTRRNCVTVRNNSGIAL